ncbi:MAG: hypothetical protein H0W99_15605 [Acidobacteria bacterium]|nr:hypothetical protein [Acidobacteriota bacterium]
MPRPKSNREIEAMRRMIQQHLQERALATPPMLMDVHLDEDALNAFVEGRLSEPESAPIIKHLVACGYCRQATSQLVRLETETGIAAAAATSPTPVVSPQEEPGRIRRLLEDLASRVLLSSEEETVFAYHAPAEDFKPRDEAGANKESSGEDETAGKQNDSDSSTK